MIMHLRLAIASLIAAGALVLLAFPSNAQTVLSAEAAVHGSHDGTVATASLIENWIDETERRTWFLSETISGS
jgi:hypothetical protein